MQNTSCAFGFLTRNSSLGEQSMYFTYLEALGNAL